MIILNLKISLNTIIYIYIHISFFKAKAPRRAQRQVCTCAVRAALVACVPVCQCQYVQFTSSPFAFASQFAAELSAAGPWPCLKRISLSLSSSNQIPQDPLTSIALVLTIYCYLPLRHLHLPPPPPPASYYHSYQHQQLKENRAATIINIIIYCNIFKAIEKTKRL